MTLKSVSNKFDWWRLNSEVTQPHRWCNGCRTRLECGRSWVRVAVGSNQRQ